MTRARTARPVGRPLLILGAARPRGRRGRARLIAEAERRSMMVATLKTSERLASVDLVIDATQADAVAVCADAPLQALVAGVAAARDLPFSCVPTGPEDLLARDLGLAVDDPLEALSLPRSEEQRTIDLGEVNGVVFVNYVAVGVRMPGSSAAGDAGEEPAEPALLVCNNRFSLHQGGLGPREWPDSGLLEVTSLSGGGLDRAIEAQLAAGWTTHSCSRFVLGASGPVHAVVDGEPRTLVAPLRFRSLPRALRVRVPHPDGDARERARDSGRAVLST
jgi:diacylglycerol kinase family enzyme